MEAVKCITSRRSVRRFTDAPVADTALEAIVAAAAYAPSWKNCQPVRYVAVRSPEVRERIAQDCVLGYAGNQAIIRGCQVLVVLSIVHGRSGFERDGSYSTSKEDRWEVFDAGIAAQTFCLAAHEAGLGTVIMGLFDETKLAETLSLPEGQKPAALIALGVPAQEPSAPPRKAVSALLTTV